MFYLKEEGSCDAAAVWSSVSCKRPSLPSGSLCFSSGQHEGPSRLHLCHRVAPDDGKNICSEETSASCFPLAHQRLLLSSSSTWRCASSTCWWPRSGWFCPPVSGGTCSGSSSGSEASSSWGCWRRPFTTPSSRASDTTGCRVGRAELRPLAAAVMRANEVLCVLLQSRGRCCSLRCSQLWRGLWPGFWSSSPVWDTASSSESVPQDVLGLNRKSCFNWAGADWVSPAEEKNCFYSAQFYHHYILLRRLNCFITFCSLINFYSFAKLFYLVQMFSQQLFVFLSWRTRFQIFSLSLEARQNK